MFDNGIEPLFEGDVKWYSNICSPTFHRMSTGATDGAKASLTVTGEPPAIVVGVV
jgi:hypothetical protein